MSEYIVTNKTMATLAVIFLIIATIVGVISYNLGVKYGLGQRTPTAVSENNNQTTLPTNQAIDNTNNTTAPETVISGEPVITGQTAILSGQVTAVKTGGFTMEVTSNVLNSQTGRLTETKTKYEVMATNQTKITQMVSAVTIPPQGGPAQITTTTRNSTLSNIKVGNTVTVTTASDLATKQLTATEIKITS